LGPTVDFLHRTVGDFLQDNYYPQLQANLKGQFSSTSALCKMCLVMLKLLPDVDFKKRLSINEVIGITDELLYYAYETERTDPSPDSSLVEVLDDVDCVNSYHARGARNHWTHARDTVGQRRKDVYREGDNYSFLALTVQARLVKYVRAKLDANPNNMRKGGRPLLDYALRPRRVTPINMKYHSKRDDPSVNVDMVQLLLERGADPNQPVHLNDGKSVWLLFLISIHETILYADDGGAKLSHSLLDAWYKSCTLLIQYGARRDFWSIEVGFGRTSKSLFRDVYGDVQICALEALLDKKEREEQQAKSLCTLM